MAGRHCAQAAASTITQCLRTLLTEQPPATLSKPEQRQFLQDRLDRVKRLVVELCSPAVHKPGQEEDVSLRLEDVERATVVVRAVFLVDRDLGLWIMEQVQ